MYTLIQIVSCRTLNGGIMVKKLHQVIGWNYTDPSCMVD